MKTLRTALRLFLSLSVLTGLLYPLLLTPLYGLLFPGTAAGSLVRGAGGTTRGSLLLAQPFTRPGYFWPRPSAADFATVPSGASNLGPTSAALRDAIAARAASLRLAHGLPEDAPVPEELLTASASGLDPHLSPEAVKFQRARVCAARAFDGEDCTRVEALIDGLTEPPDAQLLGEPRVNILRLNLALDELKTK